MPLHQVQMCYRPSDLSAPGAHLRPEQVRSQERAIGRLMGPVGRNAPGGVKGISGSEFKKYMGDETTLEIRHSLAAIGS